MRDACLLMVRRRMQDKDREAVDCEDGETQTSSPGGSSMHLGWKGFSNFLHVRRNSSSRIGSRKSSRASDAGSSNGDLNDLSSAWLGLPLPSQAILMGARHLVDATSAGAPQNIPMVVVVNEDTPSQPTTDTGLDDPEFDPLSNFRCSVGELDPDELAATAAANAGFLHPLHNTVEAWRAFSSRICDGEEGLEDELNERSNEIWHSDFSPDDNSDHRQVDSVVRADVHNSAGHEEAS
jgi:hypothetical protein